MLKEFVDRILSLAVPNIHEEGDLTYSDKHLILITPPIPPPLDCSTLQGLVDLYNGKLDDGGDMLVWIESPTRVGLVSRMSDYWGRRREWAVAKHPECQAFPFGRFMDPESFIIQVQASFQRLLIDDAQDLDYVLKIASSISAEQVQSNEDDGIAQRVATKSGVVLKSEKVLRPIVNLAPWRTFAEIDQVMSRFVFRARIGSDSVNLALFEGDGGRWKLGAVSAIKAWLQPKFGTVPVIS
jgi:hypothetical protein